MRLSVSNYLSLFVVFVSIVMGAYVIWTAWSTQRSIEGSLPAYGLSPARKPAAVASSHHVEPASESIVLFGLDEVMVNIRSRISPQKHHYVRIRLNLELFDPAATALLEARLPGIKHAVIDAIRAQDYERLNTLDGKLYFKEALVTKVNTFLEVPAVRQVHFSSFYLQ